MADLCVKSNRKNSRHPHLGGGGGQRRSEIPGPRLPGDHEELGEETGGREDGGRKERGIRFVEEDNREMSAPLQSEDSVSVGTLGPNITPGKMEEAEGSDGKPQRRRMSNNPRPSASRVGTRPRSPESCFRPGRRSGNVCCYAPRHTRSGEPAAVRQEEECCRSGDGKITTLMGKPVGFISSGNLCQTRRDDLLQPTCHLSAPAALIGCLAL